MPTNTKVGTFVNDSVEFVMPNLATFLLPVFLEGKVASFVVYTPNCANRKVISKWKKLSILEFPMLVNKFLNILKLTD